MGLLQKACETYDSLLKSGVAGKFEEGTDPLLPVGHILKKADLEITIDKSGNFIDVKKIEKGQEQTIIPVTIASGGRTSGVMAHPLCDSLTYLIKDDNTYYKSYSEQLQQWADFCKHPKLFAIKKYVEGGTIFQDLQSRNIGNELKQFVRWRVEGLGVDDVAECWRDAELFEEWTRYYLGNMDETKGICMITGEIEPLTENHPKNIIASAGNAKLISTNDFTNFTFRGRFVEGKDALSIGYQASQKAHAVLRYEASKGYNLGGRVFMCWNPQGKKTPKAWSPLEFTNDKPLEPLDYGQEVKKSLTGFRNELQSLDHIEDVVIASMDAATTGRLALTYYNELMASDFLDRIEYWYNTCCWRNGKFGIQSPSIYTIAKCAFGNERSEKGKLEVDDRLSRDTQQRLIKCIVEKAPIPSDIVRALYHKASKPESFNLIKYHNYKTVLYVACAVIRKSLNDKKEEWALELEKNKIERSYLFGRLLALFEKVERDTYDESEEREPNAIRLQSAFCDKPLYYANIIHNGLNPYFMRLKPKHRAFYKKSIGEILSMLGEFKESELNRPLRETYLLGYYLQRNELYKSKKNETNEVEEEK